MVLAPYLESTSAQTLGAQARALPCPLVVQIDEHDTGRRRPLLPFRRSADRRRPLANRVAKDVPAHGTAWANGYRSSGASEIPLAVRLATAPNGRGQAIS